MFVLSFLFASTTFEKTLFLLLEHSARFKPINWFKAWPRKKGFDSFRSWSDLASLMTLSWLDLDLSGSWSGLGLNNGIFDASSSHTSVSANRQECYKYWSVNLHPCSSNKTNLHYAHYIPIMHMQKKKKNSSIFKCKNWKIWIRNRQREQTW